jgi:hypothetical protein
MNNPIRFDFSSHSEFDDWDELESSTTSNFSAYTLDEVVEKFENFLRGVGYSFDSIQVNHFENVEEDDEVTQKSFFSDNDYLAAEEEFWASKVESAKYEATFQLQKNDVNL